MNINGADTVGADHVLLLDALYYRLKVLAQGLRTITSMQNFNTTGST